MNPVFIADHDDGLFDSSFFSESYPSYRGRRTGTRCSSRPLGRVLLSRFYEVFFQHVFLFFLRAGFAAQLHRGRSGRGAHAPPSPQIVIWGVCGARSIDRGYHIRGRFRIWDPVDLSFYVSCPLFFSFFDIFNFFAYSEANTYRNFCKGI